MARPGDPEPPVLPAPWLLALHLAPGAAFTGIFYLLSGVAIRYGATVYLALILLIPLCLLPTLMGVIFFWSRRPGEEGSLWGAIAYRDRGTLTDYLVLPVLLLAFAAVVSLALSGVAGDLEARLFGWFPDRLRTGDMLAGLVAAPPAQRQATCLLAILLSGLLAPLAEEVYFRGFLLPRMRHWGGKAPFANAFLFGAGHFFSPWALPGIFLAFLPLAYVVRARRNFRIGVVAHSLFNLMGVYSAFVFRS